MRCFSSNLQLDMQVFEEDIRSSWKRRCYDRIVYTNALLIGDKFYIFCKYCSVNYLNKKRKQIEANTLIGERRPTIYLERIYSDLTILLPVATGTLLSMRLYENKTITMIKNLSHSGRRWEPWRTRTTHEVNRNGGAHRTLHQEVICEYNEKQMLI